MTRIIAGFAGSLPLLVPGAGTRPTSDRVREAVFSALESRDAVRGSRVVDLYAGSGALGLEAASRGAASVTLVERAPAAVRACRDNVARVLRNAPKNAQPTISVASHSVQPFLDSSTAVWDIAFIDPPYEVGGVELSRVLGSLVPRLAPDAIVVLERASKSPDPVWPDGLSLDRSRKYGDTTLWWASAG
ncbi:16S rRNA (guanine966-N2)-methyltransferase [Cryobacterium mesophilum]|uniref:16S rRNA (Guanine(966)-N(2))-methyltransferase RsmD n=1 Tax=Terrimesophilobacter mesophilus TaxID=433647 RepID=A0A4R8V8A5_9MICO|nr:RsmD family RNA methyltransferase [Terrimesophilobacter mesophilus]MBB5632549.1 16S rRNA (guanine966-N2)-methyltransferase [Terrimesophilobacter mesophilus]TFB79371.1 16S rRNA (guanine(966)-N(2))-methyltransferase RsmD [Terrimesophilobacter mesophilus]